MAIINDGNKINRHYSRKVLKFVLYILKSWKDPYETRQNKTKDNIYHFL